MRYAVEIAKRDETFVATCRDVPSFRMESGTRRGITHSLAAGMLAAMQSHMEDMMPIPVPSERESHESWLDLMGSRAAQLDLYEAFRNEVQVDPALLSRVGLSWNTIRRLTDLSGPANLVHMEMALAKVGYRIRVSVEPTAVQARKMRDRARLDVRAVRPLP